MKTCDFRKCQVTKKKPSRGGGGGVGGVANVFISPSVPPTVPPAPAGQDGGNEAGKWNTDSGSINRIYLTHLIKPINMNYNDAVYGQQ